MNYNHIIFFHMLKTGGNTITSILKRQYKPTEIFQLTVRGFQTGPVDFFINMEQHKREEIKILRGHMHFGLHKYFEGKTIYFTFMRDPISRLISFYNHVHSLPNDYFRKLIPENERKTFGDFIMNIDKYHDQGNNGQSKVIAGKDISEEQILDTAISNINNHFIFVGLTERFDESVILLKKYFNWGYPYYFRRKVSKKIINKSIITAEEKELATQMNEKDIILYNYATENFNKNIKGNKEYVENHIKILRKLNLLYYVYYSTGRSIKNRFRSQQKINNNLYTS